VNSEINIFYWLHFISVVLIVVILFGIAIMFVHQSKINTNPCLKELANDICSEKEMVFTGRICWLKENEIYFTCNSRIDRIKLTTELFFLEDEINNCLNKKGGE